MAAETIELYEQAKAVLRHALEAAGMNEQRSAFVLACHECGLPFRDDIEMGMVADHVRTHGRDPDTEGVELDLVYIGEGPPPKASDE